MKKIYLFFLTAGLAIVGVLLGLYFAGMCYLYVLDCAVGSFAYGATGLTKNLFYKILMVVVAVLATLTALCSFVSIITYPGT